MLSLFHAPVIETNVPVIGAPVIETNVPVLSAPVIETNVPVLSEAGVPSRGRYGVYAEDRALVKIGGERVASLSYSAAVEAYNTARGKIPATTGYVVMYREDVVPFLFVAAYGSSSTSTPSDIKAPPSTPASPPVSEPPDPEAPWYKRWTTWAIVGGIGAVGAVVVVSSRKKRPASSF